MIQSELEIEEGLKKHKVQSTSLEALASIIEIKESRQMEVFNVLKSYGPLSNLDISRILGLPINSVTPRVKELRDKNMVVFSDKKKDKVTNRTVMVWMVVE